MVIKSICLLVEKKFVSLIPIQDRAFLELLSDLGQGVRVNKKDSLPEIRHTYPTIMKLSAVIPYLRKVKKV